MPRAAYLGPEGTHTGEAAAACEFLAGWELVPRPSIRAAVAALIGRETEAAVVPIENALEGSVGATLDALLRAEARELRIRREIVRDIAHALLGKPGARSAVKGIVSHPQALAQCAETLAGKFPGVILEPALSTAEAARLVSRERDGWLALGSREAAAKLGLEVIAPDLSDEPGNRTRFVVLALEDERPTGRDRTSIAFGLDRDRPGGLRDVLGELASRGINLSRIESRPTRQKLGEYFFFADLEAHREEPHAREALEAVGRGTAFFRLFGSYPRA